MLRLSLSLLLVALPAAPAFAQDGKSAFSVCAACHSVKQGEVRMGPTLAGVVGRRAGTVPGYRYSPALSNSQIVWDKARLSAYLADPRKTVPGTKMAFAGVSDPKRRAAIIAYLASLPAQ